MSELIAGVEVPETAAVAESARFLLETTSPLIYHHSRRVFFFGQLHAHRLGVKPDPELLYLAAMFHDTGLATPFSEAEQRFEVDGADHARKFLLERGFSATAAETVWTAIALHTTPGIPDRMGPEIAATYLGVLTDVVGFGLDELHTRPGGRNPRRSPTRRFQERVSERLLRRVQEPPGHDHGNGELRCSRALSARFPAHHHGRAHHRLGMAELTGGLTCKPSPYETATPVSAGSP